MIFITVRFTIRPERSEEWLGLVEDFTRATRNELGNIFFDWFRSVDNRNQFVLLEAFDSAEADEVHVNSQHFKKAMSWMPDVIATTPDIINVEVPSTGWSAISKLSPRS